MYKSLRTSTSVSFWQDEDGQEMSRDDTLHEPGKAIYKMFDAGFIRFLFLLQLAFPRKFYHLTIAH
jgi:hypothetical protein